MVSKKFDAVEFSTAYLATVKLYKGPYVVYENQPGICHTHKSDRVIASIRSFARSRGERLNENRLKDVLDEIAAFAFEDAQPVVVHNRVAPYLEGYIYNLGNGRFLQNMGTGISVVSTLPEGIFFTETNTMLAMPELVQKFDIKALLNLFNCNNNAQKLLLLAWLTYTIATPKAAQLPYPILVVKAPAGSGKSFMCNKIIRQLVDPCAVPSQAMPKNIKDIAISSQNNHVLIYDNLRFIRQELSDGLCVVATGGSLAGRKLYTDGEEFSMDMRCALVLNGIHTFVTESDLVSRCLNITLKPIPDEARCSESELSAKLEEQLPSLIYTLHVLTAKTIATKGSAKVLYRSRMADFSLWVAGLEAVLGQEAGVLQEAYKQNVEQAKVAGVVDDSLFVSLSTFAQRYSKSNPWHGTPHELLSALEAQTSVGLGSDMPKSAAAMSRKLHVLLDALTSNGVHVIRGRATDRYYNVWFEPKTSQSRDDGVEVTEHPAVPSSSSPLVDATHASDFDNAEELLG
ncbi:hypothetical protein [Aeromonas veronii]|uniref:hypothetical protein n=1 Tax=Aeromonas veronii TaxID=654 RepID=UPI0036731C77